MWLTIPGYRQSLWGNQGSRDLKQLVTLQPGQEQRTVPNAPLAFTILKLPRSPTQGMGLPTVDR